MASEGTTVRITHTSTTSVDDAVDPNTLKPIPNSGETPETVYEGICLLFPRGNRIAAPSGSPVEVDAYDLLLPVAAACPVNGDKAVVLSDTDPTMVDAILAVESSERSSIAGARVVHVRDLQAARPLHG